MVSVLDVEYTRLGHESVVLGRSDSCVAGRLVPGVPPGVDFETASRLHLEALERLLAREHFDVLHNQSSHVQHQLSQPPAPPAEHAASGPRPGSTSHLSPGLNNIATISFPEGSRPNTRTARWPTPYP